MNTVIGPRMSNSELQKKFELSQLNKLKEREDYQKTLNKQALDRSKKSAHESRSEKEQGVRSSGFEFECYQRDQATKSYVQNYGDQLKV